jgi:HSP20 family molecular chaperone IbpA
VTLPAEANSDEIDTQLEHGVLTIKAPKPERPAGRRVEIRGS